MIGLTKMTTLTKQAKKEIVGPYLDELFPEPKCELLYKKDYELLIAVMLSAQSTDKRVNSVTPLLFSKYKTLEKLRDADTKELEALIRSIGSYHKKAEYIKGIARKIIEDYGGQMPHERDALETFPGVGRKTVSVVLSEFYNIPAFAVDTHVERISKRLKLASKKDNVRTIEEKLKKFFPKEEWGRRHLQLVLFGRYKCKAVKPDCQGCRFKEICSYEKKDREC